MKFGYEFNYFTYTIKITTIQENVLNLCFMQGDNIVQFVYGNLPRRPSNIFCSFWNNSTSKFKICITEFFFYFFFLSNRLLELMSKKILSLTFIIVVSESGVSTVLNYGKNSAEVDESISINHSDLLQQCAKIFKHILFEKY